MYVMWYENRGEGLSGYQVATSPTPQGPFRTVNASVNMPGSGRIGDFNIFVDDDGRAFHVRTGFDIVELNEHFTGPSSLLTSLDGHADEEGPTMFKRDGVYFLTTGSDCCACVGGSSVVVWSAPAPSGPWHRQGDVGSNSGHNHTNAHDPHKYVTKSQGSAVFRVGRSDQFVYVGNQWNSGLNESPPGPRHHDLLYFGLFEFNDGQGAGGVTINQMTWHDEIEIFVGPFQD